MKNRYLVVGFALVLTLSLAIPALGGSSDRPYGSAASPAKVAKRALKKATRALTVARAARGTAEEAQQAAEDAAPLWAVVRANGSLERDEGASSSERAGPGLYRVTFERDVSECAWVAQLGTGNTTPVNQGMMSTNLDTEPDTVFVQTTGTNGVLADRPFHISVNC